MSDSRKRLREENKQKPDNSNSETIKKTRDDGGDDFDDTPGPVPIDTSSYTSIMSSLSIFSPSTSNSISSSEAPLIDPKNEAKGDQLPEKWQWIGELVNEAHLPNLGLPTKWDSTSRGHMLQAFDPKNNRTINIETKKVVKTAKSSVGFITSTKDKNPMPGTQAPAAVRYERYMEPCMNKHLVQDAGGNQLAPCIAHGDYVLVEALQSDHAQAKENILTRQISLVEELNNNPVLAEAVMKLDGIEKFFIKTKFPGDSEEKYYGTLYFYELYFNDIDNIWLICQACNHQKSNENVYEWFKDQWLYGQEFLDYLACEQKEDTGILEKSKDKQGLATVAIKWFWKRHGHYMSNTQLLFKDIITPIQILNIKADRVISEGSMKRAERLRESLGLKMDILAEVAQAKGLDMPRPDSESEHETSDEENYLTELPRKPNINEYKEARNRLKPRIAPLLKTEIGTVLTEVIKEEDLKNRSGQSASLAEVMEVENLDNQSKGSVSIINKK